MQHVPTLFLNQGRATLRFSGGSFVVTVPPENDGCSEPQAVSVEPHRLELVCIVGAAHVTSEALRECLRRGIAVAWFTLGGTLRGRLSPPTPRSGDLRIAQYRALLAPERALRLARTVVGAKLERSAEVLRSLRSNRPKRNALAAGLRELRALAGQVESCSSIGSLRGLEGAAAACYFQGLAVGFDGEIPFAGRTSRPPRDPANALLSFGYTLLTERIASMLEARGLDPAVGFLHQVRSGRPALALDLVEEFRQGIVDRFVLRSCNLGILRPAMFQKDAETAGGVRMTDEGRKRFFGAWAEFSGSPIGATGLTLAELVSRQVNRIAADLRGGVPYLSLGANGELFASRPDRACAS